MINGSSATRFYPLQSGWYRMDCTTFLQTSNLLSMSLNKFADNYTACTLPDIGTDWLPGLQDCYIIYSIKRSTPDEPQFWTAGGYGYADYWHCGVFTKQEIMGSIWRYNDGLNAVAIPLTVTALTLLGFKISIVTEALNAFANRATVATKQL